MNAGLYDIVGIGNAIVDILAEVDEEFLTRHRMTKGAMQLVDSAHIEALRSEIMHSRECSGGSVANTIAAMAQLGARTHFLGRVADDALGAVFTHDIRGAGVTFDPTPAKDGKSTACCVVCVTPDGERTMNTFIGACAEFTAEDVNDTAITSAAWLYIEGYLWDAPAAKEAILKAITIARASGTKIAFSASDTFCVHRHHAEFLQLIHDHVDVLFANEDEARALHPHLLLEEVAMRLAQSVKVVVITRSSEPAIIASKDMLHHSAAARVAKVVDATGAGDLFAAGFLHGMIEGVSLPSCAERGHRMASHIIEQLGARSLSPLTALVA
jgi:sugar/nucleoside kinase (ribokinase family)